MGRRRRRRADRRRRIGPPVGSRVVGFHGAGGWAQRRTVPTENLAILPDSVEFGPAAALPVAGVTALQSLRSARPGGRPSSADHGSLRRGRPLRGAAGRTGGRARGRGGRFRGPRRRAARRSARPRWWSASQTSPSGCSACSTTSAVSCWPKRSVCLAMVVLRSPSAWRPTSPPPSTSRPSGCQAHKRAWNRSLFAPLSGLISAIWWHCWPPGRLDPQIGLRSSWNDVSDAAEALLDRRVAGKAVLDVD